MRKFRFRTEVETCKVKAFIKILVLLFLLSALTLLSFKVKPELFNMNFLAYTLIFDLIFIFTLFPLDGNGSRKLAVLLAGNVLSFIWNCLYPLFISTFFGRNSVSHAIFQFISPVVNALWVVSMWTFGLSLVAIQKNIGEPSH